MKRQRPEAADRLGLLPFLYHPHFLKRCTQMHTNKIEMLEDGGYSRDGEWAADMRGTYGHGAVYRGRRRDSMGRYSREDAREHMHAQLEDMLRDTDDERARKAIRECMEQIERA